MFLWRTINDMAAHINWTALVVVCYDQNGLILPSLLYRSLSFRPMPHSQAAQS